MRKTMKREVTSTTVRIGKIMMVDGHPQVEQLPAEKVVGNVTLEKATKLMKKKHGQGVTVFEVEAETETYQMSVEDFLKHAEIVKEEETVEV